jgi:hypothetical protein
MSARSDEGVMMQTSAMCYRVCLTLFIIEVFGVLVYMQFCGPKWRLPRVGGLALSLRERRWVRWTRIVETSETL